MKFKVLGKEHREGVSKDTGERYSYNILYVSFPVKDTEGVQTDIIKLYRDFYPFSQIIVGKDYEVEYNQRGYIVSVCPA